MGEIYTLGDLEERVKEEESLMADAGEGVEDTEKTEGNLEEKAERGKPHTDDAEEAGGNGSRVDKAEKRTKDFEELHGEKIRRRPHQDNSESFGKQPDLRQKRLEDYHEGEIQQALEVPEQEEARSPAQENPEEQERLSPELLDQLTTYWNETQGKISFQDWLAQEETQTRDPGNGKAPGKLEKEEARERKITDFSRTGGRHSVRV